MYKSLFALAALTSISTTMLSARELMCEQCEPQPEECWEHLFVERSELFGVAEFLYWSVKEPNLEYAIKQKGTTAAANTFAVGDYATADYDWHPGFRVAATYYRCPRYWEVTAEYTWLYDKGNDSVSSLLNPARQTRTTGPFVSANSLIGFHYHLGDLYVARVFDPNPHLRMRLTGGFTIASLKQKWAMHFTNGSGDFDRVDENWCFFGGGFRMGLRADWFWGCQFYLTGKTTFAALIGSYENDEIQVNGVDRLLLSNAKYDDQRMAMHLQMMLGPSWQVPCDCWSFELFAGWEFNLWSNMQERIRTQFNGQMSSKEVYHSSGLLGMQGFTLRLTLGF